MLDLRHDGPSHQTHKFATIDNTITISESDWLAQSNLRYFYSWLHSILRTLTHFNYISCILLQVVSKTTCLNLLVIPNQSFVICKFVATFGCFIHVQIKPTIWRFYPRIILSKPPNWSLSLKVTLNLCWNKIQKSWKLVY